MLSNYLFKSQHADIYNLLGLDPKKPFAEGLEPADYLALTNNKKSAHVEKQFSYNYLHNVSNSKLERNQAERKHTEEVVFEFYIPALRNEAYNCLYKLIKAMKETCFAQQFPRVFEHLWCLIRRSQPLIEQLNGIETENTINMKHKQSVKIQQNKEEVDEALV